MAPSLDLGGRLCAGVRAKASSLLDDDFFWRLLDLDSVGEIVYSLAESEPYGRYFEGLDLKALGRIDVEEIVYVVPFLEAERFFTHFRGVERRLVETFRDRWIMEYLKRLLRRLRSSRADRDYFRRLARHFPRAPYPLVDLAEADTFHEVARLLAPTPLGPKAASLVAALDDPGTPLFPIEMALDRRLFSIILDLCRSLGGPAGKALLGLFGTEADLANLSWIRRGRRYYAMDGAELVGALMPGGKRIGPKDLNALVQAPSEEALWRLLRSSPYGELFEEGASEEELSMERAKQRRLRDEALRLYHRGVPGLQSVMALLFLRRFETFDVITLVEDVRYGFDRRQGALFLCRPLIPGGEIRWPS
ncbi:MAG: V-type ATPase subunit [Synergistaceae bacterium]|nr:V-type ATPase subunit [Synergistaceae bacterium]